MLVGWAVSDSVSAGGESGLVRWWTSWHTHTLLLKHVAEATVASPHHPGSLRCSITPNVTPQAKFGIPIVAENQLEIYTTAVLQASIKPPSPPREAAWRDLMNTLGDLSCKAYRWGGVRWMCVCVGGVAVAARLLCSFLSQSPVGEGEGVG